MFSAKSIYTSVRLNNSNKSRGIERILPWPPPCKACPFGGSFMRGVSLCYIVVFCSAILCACGPAFEAYNYGDVMGGGSGTGPILNDPGLPPGANIVRNASFEGDLSVWEDWGGSSLLTVGAHSGGKAVRISGSGQGGIGQEVIYRIQTGATYQLKAQAKVASLSDEVYVGVRFFDLSNGTIADFRTRVQTTSYKEHSVSLKVPTGASSAKVYVWKQSSFNSFADVDDFSMVMTAEPEPPLKQAPVANPDNVQPLGPSGQWTLVFDENFSGTRLNTTWWNTGFWYNTTINNELQAYRPENVRVGGGYLQLVAEQRSTQTTWGEPKNYASGAITTRNKFTFTFGVVEARLRVPVGQGLSSLFQIEPNNKRSPPSITVMHALGQMPTVTSFNYRYYDINGVVRGLVNNVTGMDFSDSYHTFTVEWTATHVNFYVDGVLRGSYSGSQILRDPAFLILNLAVGGTVPSPVSNVGFPQTLQVDYIRVWQ